MQQVENQAAVLCLTCLYFLNASVPPSGSRRRAAPETEVCVWVRWSATVWSATERACCCWSASWSPVTPLRWMCADSAACWDTLGGKLDARALFEEALYETPGTMNVRVFDIRSHDPCALTWTERRRRKLMQHRLFQEKVYVGKM